MIRYPILVVAGLLSAPLLDIGSVVWMRLMPMSLDLTANYILMVVLPVVLILHFSMALILWKAFEPAPFPGSAVYLGTHAASQTLMLTLLNNAPMDIVEVVLTLLASGTLILYVFNRYFWCQACAALR
ncbi:MAG: hypothetical protein PVH91_12050 [Pseudomonadales bacterium]|jgi:hypothetical protein